MKEYLKKIAILLFVAITISSVFSNCIIISSQAAAKVRLNYKEKEIYEGDTFKMKVVGTKKKVKWYSSNSDVATVSQKGVVTGFDGGEKKRSCKIIAKVNGKKYVCKLTVKVWFDLGDGENQEDDSEEGDSEEEDDSRDEEANNDDKKIEYGTVSGNITYHYNDYKGYVPDPNSPVFLIPKDSNLKNIDNSSFEGISYLDIRFLFQNAVDTLKKIGIYGVRTDGMGNYSISHVPTGEYLVYIISAETNTRAWFDADDKENYYRFIATPIEKYVNKDLAILFGKAASMNAFGYESVTVYANENSTVSYTFPYTYIK